jgi:hypothetical protein
MNERPSNQPEQHRDPMTIGDVLKHDGVLDGPLQPGHEFVGGEASERTLDARDHTYHMQLVAIRERIDELNIQFKKGDKSVIPELNSSWEILLGTDVDRANVRTNTEGVFKPKQ